MAFKSKITPNIAYDSNAPSTLTPVITGAQTLTVIGLSIANTSSTTITVSVKLIKSGTGAFMIKTALVEAGNALVIVGGEQKVVLEAGDSITAYVNNANSADAIISYLI